eukprot:5541371-Amphidinium_carterae.2
MQAKLPTTALWPCTFKGTTAKRWPRPKFCWQRAQRSTFIDESTLDLSAGTQASSEPEAPASATSFGDPLRKILESRAAHVNTQSAKTASSISQLPPISEATMTRRRAVDLAR